MRPRDDMKIGLTPGQWNELSCHSYRVFVRAAFYLGLPYTYIKVRTSDPAYEEDRVTTIETALELGMTPQDEVYIITLKGPGK